MVEAFVQGSDVFAILPTGYFTAIYLFFKALYGYRWPTGQMAISNYVCTDYVITFLQYKSRIRMTPDPCAGRARGCGFARLRWGTHGPLSTDETSLQDYKSTPRASAYQALYRSPYRAFTYGSYVYYSTFQALSNGTGLRRLRRGGQKRTN